MKMRAHLMLCLLTSISALAGAKPPYGGALKVATVSEKNEGAAGPIDTAIQQLTRLPLCQAIDVTNSPTGTSRLVPKAGVSAKAIETAINSLTSSTGPYSRLLELTKAPSVSADGVELDTPLRGADLQMALCHPMLALSEGPFARAADKLTAVTEIPTGRPWVDEVALSSTDSRASERLLTSRRAHVLLGAGNGDGSMSLFATFLLRNQRVPEGLQLAVTAAVDRGDLTRFFVRAPAEPMLALTWPPTADAAKAVTPAKPAPLSPVREVKLAFDSTNVDHRAVAERLQVKLQTFGYRIVLQPIGASELASLWKEGKHELLLMSALLSPSVRVSATITGQLAPATQLTPLYVRGLGVTAGPEVRNLHRTPYGLPDLADVFLSAE